MASSPSNRTSLTVKERMALLAAQSGSGSIPMPQVPGMLQRHSSRDLTPLSPSAATTTVDTTSEEDPIHQPSIPSPRPPIAPRYSSEEGGQPPPPPRKPVAPAASS